MSIVNYSLDNELIGARNLGTDRHRRLHSRLSTHPSQQHTPKTLTNSEHFTSKLPHILKEKEFNLKNSNINKIFTAQWLDERKCIMGTKCNKLVVLDTVTGKYSVQNPLKSHPNSRNIQNNCGIHSISINPSRTLLATGAEHVNDIGIYSLPSLEPVLAGFNAHKYWIFDMVWPDDDHVVTGAGDNRLALWTVNNEKLSDNYKSNRINYSSSSPVDFNNQNKILNYLDVDGRIDRRYLKRPTPINQIFGSRIPVRPSPSSSFFRDFNNRPVAANTDLVLMDVPLSPTSPATSFNRFGFFSYENFPSADSNRRLSLNSLMNRYQMTSQNSNRDSSSNVNQVGLLNDNITEDEDEDEDEDDAEEEEEEDEEEEDFGGYVAEELFSTERALDFHPNFTDDDESNGSNQEDEEYDQADEYDEAFDLKRRRLNFYGKFKKNVNSYKYKTPTKVIKCKQSKRIRALAFNPKRNEIAAISMNAAFHFFDINRFEQKCTKKLSPLKENVCLTINSDFSMYAVGSASHVQLLDANNPRAITHPIFIKKDIGTLPTKNNSSFFNDLGVRSLHFRNNIVSIGTGIGTVLFYDVRVNKFLFDENESSNLENHLTLQTNGGWILRNETYYENLSYAHNTDNSHAIYSHSYDPTGTKLLTVGGPLTINLYGHYAGVWQ